MLLSCLCCLLLCCCVLCYFCFVVVCISIGIGLMYYFTLLSYFVVQFSFVYTHTPEEGPTCPTTNTTFNRHNANIQDMLDNYKRHMVVIKKFGAYIPKHHATFHLLCDALRLGNPMTYHTFADEGLNKVLKQVLRNCSQLNFEATAFSKLEALLRSRAKRARC